MVFRMHSKTHMTVDVSVLPTAFVRQDARTTRIKLWKALVKTVRQLLLSIPSDKKGPKSI